MGNPEFQQSFYNDQPPATQVDSRRQPAFQNQTPLEVSQSELFFSFCFSLGPSVENPPLPSDWFSAVWVSGHHSTCMMRKLDGDKTWSKSSCTKRSLQGYFAKATFHFIRLDIPDPAHSHQPNPVTCFFLSGHTRVLAWNLASLTWCLHTSLIQHISYFLYWCENHLTQVDTDSLRKGFILAPGLRSSITMMESTCKHASAGHAVSTVRKQRSMNAGIQFTFPFWCSQELSPDYSHLREVFSPQVFSTRFRNFLKACPGLVSLSNISSWQSKCTVSSSKWCRLCKHFLPVLLLLFCFALCFETGSLEF